MSSGKSSTLLWMEGPHPELFLLYSAAICYVYHCEGGRCRGVGGGGGWSAGQRVYFCTQEHYVTLNRIFNHNIIAICCSSRAAVCLS